MAEPKPADALRHTPLRDEHVAAGARLVPFAGYAMPVQYPTGILAEHLWTREHAGLFDVSHMGQAALAGPDHETAARALEALIPADVLNLKPGQQRYSQLLAADGGILDDLMVTRPATEAEAGHLYLVVNASTKEADYAHIAARLPSGVTLVHGDDRALLALQGPAAEGILRRLGSKPLDPYWKMNNTFQAFDRELVVRRGDLGVADLTFMEAGWFEIAGVRCHVSRSGYTGEDGFEISVKDADAAALWRALLADPEVKPIGLGARDSLRLEAGLCLYGHDIDTTTTPVEAGLTWSIQKRRRLEGGFPGAERIRRDLAEGVGRVRVGLRPEGRAPAREGSLITTPDRREVGVVTSGGFGPSVDGPVAMGYVAPENAAPGNELLLIVRGRPMPAKVVPLPFAPHRYKRG